MPKIRVTGCLFLALSVLNPSGAHGTSAHDNSAKGASARGASVEDLERIEGWLDAGRVREADSLFQETFSRGSPPLGLPGGASSARHRLRIVEARLAATQGNWQKTVSILSAWRTSADRREGSGEVLFWLGWAALHQGKMPEADSLFVLASAYAGKGSQEALEYRFAALLDSPPALLDYLRGLPESPLPASLRVAALEHLPATSRLHPYGQWQLALLLEVRGDTVRAREALAGLAANLSSLPGRKAAARLSSRLETAAPDSAKRGYEALLLKQQQGVSAEFSRKRLQELRSGASPR